MVIPFFGRKPPGAESAASADVPPKAGKDTTSLMEFTQIGGDMGRALAVAADKIQVSEAATAEDPVLEEAAVLYANANAGGAQAVLEGAIDAAGASATQAMWNMLFDLYRLQGDRAAFDARAVGYAQQFEISPPIWGDDNTKKAKPAPRDAAPSVNLSGTLAATAAKQFEQLTRIGAKAGKLRMDLSRLRGVDDAGCALLNKAFDELAKVKAHVQILGAVHALSLLSPRLKTGEKEAQDFWRVALRLLQQIGDQDKFDEVALDYAITFEESPPSFEAPPPPTASDALAAQAAENADEDDEEDDPEARGDFILEGDIIGSQPEVLRKLAAYAHTRNPVVLDASHLKRLEFVSAGSLFNSIVQLQGQGKLTVIRHPNALVASLLQVMGIHHVAQIELRRR